MIRLENITAGYELQNPVLQNLTLTLPKTGIVAFTGPSGSGKTTLLRLIAGLLKPFSGTISGLEEKRISMVFQEDRLLPWCTVLQNVTCVGAEATARQCLENMELGEHLHRYPGELSGGMQRRVAIARALCFGGDVLVLDEPFKGLDPALKERIFPHIRDAAPLILLVTHDEQDVQALGAVQIKIEKER